MVHKLTLLAIILGTIVFGASPVIALGSTNYQIREDFLGGGGSIDSNSANYNSQDTAGGAAVGAGASNAYKTESGATTPQEPTLTVSIDTANVNLGAFSSSIAKTSTSTFSVINQTSYGYIVQIIGSPPNNGAHALTNLASQTGSSVGSEQFGINLASNTAPAIFGAAPNQVPDNTFSFGEAAAGYSTANVYKYVPGDTIAAATKSSGKTVYTISYLANIANSTPGGSYSTNQTLIITGTY